MKTTQTDNHNLTAKLDLRRALLNQLPAKHPLSVVDCFSGESEAIWTQLRREFNVGEYLALDIKPKDRRLKLDSLRYLQNQKWAHDVVDLDAYGSPWAHWFEVLKRGIDCTVFLTIGSVGFRRQQSEGLAALGITFEIPGGLHGPVAEMVTDHCIGKALERFKIESCLEAMNPGGNARYIGLRLKKLSEKNAAKARDSVKA